MKTTRFFVDVRKRADRKEIRDAWIARAIGGPAHERIQADGRIRRWVRIDEMDGRWQQVVLLADGETVHHAFFDRGFDP